MHQHTGQAGAGAGCTCPSTPACRACGELRKSLRTLLKRSMERCAVQSRIGFVQVPPVGASVMQIRRCSPSSCDQDHRECYAQRAPKLSKDTIHKICGIILEVELDLSPAADRYQPHPHNHLALSASSAPTRLALPPFLVPARTFLPTSAPPPAPASVARSPLPPTACAPSPAPLVPPPALARRSRPAEASWRRQMIRQGHQSTHTGIQA